MTVVAFDQQSVTYFTRPSCGRPDGPVDHAAAWTAAEMDADPERWRRRLSADMVEALSRSADALIARGVPMEGVTRESFDLSGFEAEISGWRDQLSAGLGVVCLRGLPVREWGDEKSALVYWGLGHQLGSPGAQNPARELLGHVKNYEDAASAGLVRLYRTSGDIAFHCDAADVVGLLCLRTAQEGGQSRIASSVSVFNDIARRRPDLVPELFETFDVDRRDEEPPGESPVFRLTPCAWDGSSLRTFWHSDYMRSADRHDLVEISDRRRELMDLYEASASSPEHRLDMWLEEGDIQLISNHSIVHSRTGYVDHADVAERRHLLRLWLSLGR